ncbi:MAG: hypothetical protein PHQ54_02865 [Candidatus Omnitrophica bacterium]|nr:hypothetical protein [Candidatus Omnitrophota bacterium]
MRFLKASNIIGLIVTVSLIIPLQSWARRTQDSHLNPEYEIIGHQDVVTFGFIDPNAILIKDSKGNVFVVLDKPPGREYLAYLLGRGIFNIPEIRIIQAGSQSKELAGWLNKNELSRAGISMLVQNSGELAMQDNSLEGLIVFWILLRDGDHHFNTNLGYLNAEDGSRIYISYDHDKMILGTVSIPEWITGHLQANFRRLFNVGEVNPDTLLDIARRAQDYYSDERLAAIVKEAGFTEEVLQTLKDRRDSLLMDTERLLAELKIPLGRDLVFESKEHGDVILRDDVLKNVIYKYHPEVVLEYIAETLNSPDRIKTENYPPQHAYTKRIGDRLIHVKINHKGEIFWAASEKLIIWPGMTEKDTEEMFTDGGYYRFGPPPEIATKNGNPKSLA